MPELSTDQRLQLLKLKRSRQATAATPEQPSEAPETGPIRRGIASVLGIEPQKGAFGFGERDLSLRNVTSGDPSDIAKFGRGLLLSSFAPGLQVAREVADLPDIALQGGAAVLGSLAGGARAGVPGEVAGGALGSGAGRLAIRGREFIRGEGSGATQPLSETLGEARDEFTEDAKLGALIATGFGGLRVAGKVGSKLLGKEGIFSGGAQRALAERKRSAVAGFQRTTKGLRQTAGAVTEKRLRNITKAQKNLSQFLDKAATATVIKARPVIKKIFRESSDIYSKKYDEAVEATKDIRFQADELSSFVREQFADIPGKTDEMLDALGLGKIETPVTEANLFDFLGKPIGKPTAPRSITPASIDKNIKRFTAKIGKPAKESKRVVTASEMKAANAKAVLSDFLSSKGVTQFENPRAYWRQWAPVRNQIMKFRPFLDDVDVALDTEAGARILKGAAKGKADPLALVDSIEKKAKVKINDQVKSLMQQLDENQSQIVAEKLRSQGFLQQLQKARDLELEQLKRGFAGQEQRLGQQVFLGKVTGIGFGIGASALISKVVMDALRGGSN